MKWTNTRGFSLIELLVVVTIVALLAMIAYPSYTKQVQKSRRETAESCLMELAQYMERYYTTNMTYANATLPTTDCRQKLSNFYNFSFSGTPTATAFTIQAAPIGTQASDSCGNLSVNQLGTKTPTTSGCWGD